MTTTVDISSTITSTQTSTQTQVVKGILDLYINTSASADNGGITLGKKSDPESTVSTIRSSSTTTSKPTTKATSSSPVNIGESIFSNTDASASSTHNNSKIGIAIGMPIAILFTVILVVVLYVYLRLRKSNAEKKNNYLQSYYDEKYNYRSSPINDTSSSPYNSRTIYQFKADSYKYSHNNSQFDNQSSTIVPTTNSVPSIKEVPQGVENSKKWQAPIHKWFDMSKSAISSRASLSTGIFSPITPSVPLREFNLKKSHSNSPYGLPYDEKSPILPSFPKQSYMGSSNNRQVSPNHTITSSPNGSIKTQIVQADATRREIFLQHPSDNFKTKKVFQKNKTTESRAKPLPKVPSTSNSEQSLKSLAGSEKIVMERMIPTTPVVDFAKYKNDSVYHVAQSYERNLTDELTIKEGDLVKVLARHTDGWCLAEKCDVNGNPLYKNTNRYINEGRGVIPELCLQGNVH